MAHLDRFKDTATQCWSRIDLDSGEPIFIGVTPNGDVVVKKSNLGILGKKLYDQPRTNVAFTKLILSKQISKFDTPADMTDRTLKTFTQIALDSKSAEELKNKLDQTLE